MIMVAHIPILQCPQRLCKVIINMWQCQCNNSNTMDDKSCYRQWFCNKSCVITGHFNGWSLVTVLKLGSCTSLGSNTHWVVQQHEWNKCLGLFKHWVSKISMVPCIKKNEHISNISLDMWPTMHPLLEITTYTAN